MAAFYLRYLSQIDRETDKLERRLRASQENKELYELLTLAKSLVYFTTSLRSNSAVLKRLMRTPSVPMYEEDEELLEDVLVETKQAIEMAEIYSNILSGMMDAFASVISNNLNRVMKFLASVTILVSVPGVVAAFYGMNVKLPLMGYVHAFAFVVGVSAGGDGGLRAAVLAQEVLLGQSPAPVLSRGVGDAGLDDAIAPQVLGFVQRLVGARDQRLEGRRVARAGGHAAADGDGDVTRDAQAGVDYLGEAAP